MINYQPDDPICATGLLQVGNNKTTVYFIGVLKQNSSLPVNFTLWSNESHSDGIISKAMDSPNIVAFEGQTESGIRIWIMGIEVRQLTGACRLEGSALIYIDNDIDDIREAKYGCYYSQKKPLTLAAIEGQPGI